MTDKTQVLRYAELVMKKEARERQNQQFPPEEARELDRLRADLHMSHEDAMRQAAELLFKDS